MASETRITTGQFDFSDGVDSSRVPLIQSPINPNGLKRTQLSWLSNGTVRAGGIQTRYGFNPLVTVHAGNALYQGGFLYDATALGGNPYLMLSIGGRMYQVRVDTDNSVHDVTGAFVDSATVPQAFFAQAERFLIKQCGDGVTRPLFWDGTNLSRSVAGQIPPGFCMVYYMNRLWYAQNIPGSNSRRMFIAGDLAFSITGQDSDLLGVTQNPIAVGGDGFSVPGQAGAIRALSYPIALDTSLGQGPLFIFTRNQIYALTVPVTRTDWIAANAANQPQQRVVMNGIGAVSDRSVVPVNGDLWFQTIVNPTIASYFMSLRYFGQWQNSPVSNNMNRLLSLQDRSLMHTSSGMTFSNRLFQTALPFNTPVGIAAKALAVLDFDPISSLQDQKPPAWDGGWEDLDFLQIFSGDFGGLERAFAVVVSRVDGSIQVWEFSQADRFDRANTASERRTTMQFETPAHDWSDYPRNAGGGPMSWKELDGLDLWLDRIFGEVLITVEYRVDQDACWNQWFTAKVCASRNSCEDLTNNICYPLEPKSEGYRMPLSFPKPKGNVCQLGNGRPTTLGYSFQLRITIKGFGRVRGYHLHALPKDSAPFYRMVC